MTSPATPPPPPTPELTFLYTLHCKVQNALYTAEVPWGTRAVLPITGGNFSGPRLKGEVLDLGADWVGQAFISHLKPRRSIQRRDRGTALA